MSAPDSHIDRLWTYADLMVRYGVGARQIRRVVKTLKLKPVNLGNRTVRFRPVAVMAAEEAAEEAAERRGRESRVTGHGSRVTGHEGEEDFKMPDRRRNRRPV
jgi:hypothetical protein